MTPGKARSRPAGDEAFPSSNASDRPPAENAAQRENGGASRGRRLGDIENLQRTATDYFRRLTASAGDLSTQARRVYDSSESFVRSHPGQTVGGAFVAGLVLGLLMGRD